MIPAIANESSSQEVVIIYIFRSLPFICLLVVFFYLNRDKKQVTASRPAVEHAVESERPDEDLEAGETQRSETEEAKKGDNVSEQEKKRVNNEKPEVTAATEEEEDEEKQIDVVVDTEQGTSPMHDNEKNKTESVLNTDEKTHLMTDAEEVTVSVLGGFGSAL
ncbi:high mobility group B protein 7-like [Sinocyclocheilus rhinocerous]|uniref:high mobility group B protein 7-like n=1 Tax=Sinocyclocheilus rhinocerous TaxID=307959 RepID=UPI0007BA87BD|nr:PREDICTED: high mobility group B protein 7-like [Sinocyclocheilus rhinocerous]